MARCKRSLCLRTTEWSSSGRTHKFRTAVAALAALAGNNFRCDIGTRRKGRSQTVLSSPSRTLLSAAVAILAAATAFAQNSPQPGTARPGQNPPAPDQYAFAGTRNAGGRPVHNEAERAARWK